MIWVFERIFEVLIRKAKNMKKGIVIPCFNDASNLNLTQIEKFIDCNPRHVICFVNNASQDETLLVLKNFQRHLLNSHKSLATQFLIMDLPKKEQVEVAIEKGKNHLIENTLIHNITVLGRELLNRNPMQKIEQLVNAA